VQYSTRHQKNKNKITIRAADGTTSNRDTYKIKIKTQKQNHANGFCQPLPALILTFYLKKIFFYKYECAMAGGEDLSAPRSSRAARRVSRESDRGETPREWI